MSHVRSIGTGAGALAVLAVGLAALGTGGGAVSGGQEKEAGMTSDVKPGEGIEVLDDAFKAVLAPNAAVRKVADGFQFTEGPVWIADAKCLLFSDIPADTIVRWEAGKGASVFRKPSHNSNGNTVDREGRLVTCEHGSRTVTRTGKDGQVVTLASTYQGKRLNSPNDVVVKRDGTIWFTDPPYGIDPKTREQEANRVYRLDPDAKEPVALVADLDRPNGLCFSPDEKCLYVANSDGKPENIRRYRVTADNRLEGGEVFATIRPGVPDGMRVDKDGRLYSTAGDGVHVFGTDGKLLGKFRAPETPANCAFGGADGRTLFMTAHTGLYAVDLAVGAP